MRQPSASIALLLLLTSGLAASSQARDAAARWQPRLSFGVLAQQQGAQARVQSSLFTLAPTPPAPLAPLDFDKDASLFTVALPLGAELMGPGLGEGSAAPRPFLGVAYQIMPTGQRQFFEQGDPGSAVSPAPPGSQGLGAHLDLDLRHQWHASAGLALPHTVLDRPVQLRGSFDYLGQLARLDAKVVGVDAADTVFRIGWNETQAFHFIGPRLGIETEAGRRGPLRFVVFLDVAGYFLVGDSGVSARTSLGAETGQFRYEPERFTFQGGLGLRLIWDPFGD